MNTCTRCGVPIPDGETQCDKCSRGMKRIPGNETLTVGDGFRFGLGFGAGMLIFAIIIYSVLSMIGSSIHI